MSTKPYFDHVHDKRLPASRSHTDKYESVGKSWPERPTNAGKVRKFPLPNYETEGQEFEARDDCPCSKCRRLRRRRLHSDRADGWVIAERVTWVVLILATGLYAMYETGQLGIMSGVW